MPLTPHSSYHRRFCVPYWGTPPSWTIAEAAIAAGAKGGLTPSVQNAGGVTLMLWRWHAATNEGDGAALALIDPMAALD